MKSVQKIDLGLTGYDELFMNDAERKENKLPRIYDIPLSEIDDFPDHPFKVKLDEDMDQLVQSIKERGIITPVTLRPKEDGRYEIVSGHRRKKACELAGFDTVKAEVREMTRDEAIILMVESNLQRSVILPSEKAFSYKMRLEAMKRQAGRPSKENASPVATNFLQGRSDVELGEQVGESKDQVRRYIRLTELIPELLDLVDEGRIAFRPAVELSYLQKEEQGALLEQIAYEKASYIVRTLAARLEKFNLESLASLTSTDELELETLGEKKTALFALIPDNDTSFNFLVSILYTQLFQQLFYSADHIHGGSLPIPVHFLMDEFANVSLPDDFDKILSVMRSRSVSVSIILQNLAQLKALFEKQWESIVGNCDEFLYLGGNEQSTHKYVSELLGKSTIDTNTYGKSEGRSGSYSTNYQISGRELLTPDEVRMLDNRYAILFIRGERPVLDFKYDILKHPNVALTADGKAGVYEHGEVKSDVATIELLSFDKYKAPETEVAETNYELLSDEDFEND